MPTHIQYIISGRIKVVLEDGTEEELGPGDASVIPAGHKTWVIGNEPVVGIGLCFEKPSFFRRRSSVNRYTFL